MTPSELLMRFYPHPPAPGRPPNLTGSVCEALLVAGFEHDGTLVSDCNVVYLRANGTWHRFFIDAPELFWRTQDEPPEPWEIPEQHWRYPLRDIGTEFELKGQRIQEITAASRYQAEGKAAPIVRTVCVSFESGACFTLSDHADESSFFVTTKP